MTEVGTELPEYVVADVQDKDIALVALILRDPNPIHYDLAAVRAAGLGDRAVNQGGATMAYLTTMLERWTGRRDAVRSLACRFRGVVTAGDDVVCGGRVVAVEPGADGALLATCEVWADVRGGRRAIEGTAKVRVAADEQSRTLRQ